MPRIKHPTGRLVEMLLIIMALAMCFLGYLSINVNRTGSLPTSFILHMSVLAAFALATHFAVRFLAPYADPLLLPAVLALNGIGLVMIYRLGIRLRFHLLCWFQTGIIYTARRSFDDYYAGGGSRLPQIAQLHVSFDVASHRVTATSPSPDYWAHY